MKQKLFFVLITGAMLTLYSCGNNSKSEKGTHKHEDGSTHSDHDTTKPSQQEFKVTDTTKKDTATHKHADGKEHSH
jgi:hypothetical protein